MDSLSKVAAITTQKPAQQHKSKDSVKGTYILADVPGELALRQMPFLIPQPLDLACIQGHVELQLNHRLRGKAMQKYQNMLAYQWMKM